jgi:DNA-binding CsgD family transcriptional regulator
VSTPEVVGRDRELADLNLFFEATDRLPAAMVLEGEPGIGKTTLWRRAVDIARERSYRVLSCSPVPSETRLSLASFRDLLEDVFGTVEEWLPAPQRRALAVALLREDPGPTELDPGGLAVAFLGALRVLAAERPVLVAVDDVQSLDSATRALLEFAARRLRREPVAFLLATRPPGPEGAVAVTRGLLAGEVARIALGPLSLGALSSVLRDRLGIAFPRSTLLRVHEISRGNPFFAVEIGRALERGGNRVAPGEPLPVPADVAVLVGARIAQLPPAVREVLLTVALLSDPVRSLVEAAAARGAAARLRKAAELGVIELDETRIRFVHPLLAAAVYVDAPPGLRRRIHRRLADVVTSPEERTRHLALSAAGPDAAVATALDEAARAALARGAPASAAELSEHATKLTPPELVEEIKRRSIEAADYHLHAGDTARAGILLEEALAHAPRGPDHAAALQGLATVRLREESFAAAQTLLEQALAESGDASHRAGIGLNLTVCLLQLGQLDSATAHAKTALALAEELRDAGLAAAAMTYLAMLTFLRGGGLRADLITRAVTLARRAEPGARRGLSHVLPPEFSWGVMLKWADEPVAAQSKLEAVRRRAEAEHEEGWLPAILFHLGELGCWLGDFDLASRCVRDAHDVAQMSGSPTMEAAPLGLRALTDAYQGRVDAARSAARDGLALAVRSGNLLHRIRCLAVLGFVDLSLDEPKLAYGHLEAAAGLAVGTGCVDPGVLRFPPDQIEALLRLGRLEEAGHVLEDFQERARSLGRSSALATAGRCRGLLLAAEGDLEGAVASLEEAVAAHELVPMPFERARTLLALGSTLRRAKQKAAPRASLTEALVDFDRLGTPLWGQKARAELARVGGRAPAGTLLTPSERRLADLVSEGRSNKEIAAALFVTAKTVETSLTRLYGKLGVHSRTELVHRLSQRT